MADLRLVPVEDETVSETILDFHPVAYGVHRLRIVFVNLYAVETTDGGFVLIDTGIPGTAGLVRNAVTRRFGEGARPRAILLTHAHFDHVGNAKALAEAYDVPVYLHLLELPYVSGDADYAPADPTPGGAIAFMSRFMPTKGVDLGERARKLPSDGSVPELAGWRWLPTPGHSPGHVSFVRGADRLVIVGDAFASTDLDDWVAVNTWPQEVSRPAVPFTPDWESSRSSLHALADLDPQTVATGHGKPIEGADLGQRLRDLAEGSLAPTDGRYTDKPVTYDAEGRVASLPPAKSDPLPKKLMVAGAVAVFASILLRRRR